MANVRNLYEQPGLVQRMHTLGTFILVAKRANKGKGKGRDTYSACGSVDLDHYNSQFKLPKRLDNHELVFNYTINKWTNVPHTDIVSVFPIPVKAEK